MADKLDIERRKPVWVALSEFYLDTELSSEDFDRIVTVFRQSGYTLKELKEIDLYEVFTLLQANLLSATGVWASFKEEWLVSECGKLYEKRSHIGHRMICRFLNCIFYWMRRGYWKEIEKRMTSN
jgi:hypothetical protein